MVVFGVAHPGHVVGGKPELGERGIEPAGLVHARGEHDDGALVENHLQLEPEPTDDVEHGRLLRLPRGDDPAAHRERRDPPRSQRRDEFLRRRLGERLLGAVVRAVEDGAVFRHHPVEQDSAGGDLQQIRERRPVTSSSFRREPRSRSRAAFVASSDSVIRAEAGAGSDPRIGGGDPARALYQPRPRIGHDSEDAV